MALLRIGVLGQAEDLHAGRADRVVDDAAELAELVDVVELVRCPSIEPSYAVPRDMPRARTVKPVAFATIACSKLIFEPSANDVTIAGFCPHCSAKPFCVSGLR